MAYCRRFGTLMNTLIVVNIMRSSRWYLSILYETVLQQYYGKFIPSPKLYAITSTSYFQFRLYRIILQKNIEFNLVFFICTIFLIKEDFEFIARLLEYKRFYTKNLSVFVFGGIILKGLYNMC